MLDFRKEILTLALQSPETVAVVDASGVMSRNDLTLLAGGVAAWVSSLPDRANKTQIIAILAPSGSAQIAAMLGVAASGAVFMPIDPDLPAARIRAMLDSAVPVGMLHTDALGELASELAPEMPHAALEQTAPTPLELTPMRPDAAAYVMFTSGSTGVPKGILGRYKSLNHFFTWQRDTFGLDATTRTAQLAPVTFDVSLRDVLLPLALGGVVTVPSRDLLAVPRKLLNWLSEHEVTLLHCVPSMLRLLTSELEEKSGTELATPQTLSHLFLAGEPLLGRDVKAWRAVTEGTETTIINLYGPSETTLAKVFFRVGADADLPDGMLPIGHSLPDTQVLILKPDRIAVTGEIGEICIRTGYPSLGYLHDPEATRAGFQRNAFGTEENDILYRSGDMGRLRPDGQIECLGRRDSQVKIAGNRVEGAEVEATLLSLPNIKACAVVINREDSVVPFLVAYVTGTDDTDALRDGLREKLPEYMIPRFIVPLATIPTLMNGKIDKNALPRPEELIHGTAGAVPAETPTERKVEAIWQQILGLDTVGVDTLFANLGGDSLRAIKVLGAIYRETGIELRITDFFAARTIRGLAALLDNTDNGTGSTMIAIPRAPSAPHDPLSDAQEPLWAMQRIGLDPSVYNLCFGFCAEDGLDLPRFERAFGNLIQSHEILRTRIEEIDGSPRSVILHDLNFRIETSLFPKDLSFHDAAQNLLQQERQRPFDLGVAPLVRVVAAQETHGGPVFLVISFHHAICDGESLNTIVDQLGKAYASDVPLPVPALQYRDVIAWQSERLAGPEAVRLREFWKTSLESAPHAIDLPEAQPRPSRQQFSGSTLRYDLPNRLAFDLITFAREHDSSLFNALLTGMAIALDQRADQQDMVIATPVLGRNHPDLVDQIGFFANTLCMRVKLDRDASVTDTLGQVTRWAHAAIDHQDWPFNRLVADLNKPRDLSRNPICNVMLVLFDANRPELELPGVKLTPFGRDTEWAFSRFDLVFHVTHNSRTGELVLDLNHDTALFNSQQAAQISRHFETILEQMTATPERAIGALSPFDGAQTALIAGLDRSEKAAEEVTLTALFKKVVQKAPDAIAVEDDQMSLSYVDLDHWANGIAQDLVLRGIGQDQIVAVTGAQSAAGVVAIMGILKAGGAWVALDERWPLARRDAVLRDSGAMIIINADAANDSPQAIRVQDINPTEVAIDRANPMGIAYAVFTSGSTGKPKGVMVEHRAVANMLRQQIAAFGIIADSRVLQFAAPVFDAHVSEVFVTLLGGGRLVIPSRGTLENPELLKRFMAEHGITYVTLPPSFLDVVRDILPETLKVLVTAGEALRLEEALRLSNGLRLINAYGPAENSVCSTMHQVDPHDQAREVPIGLPIDGTGLTLLDGSGRPVPIGVPGEIMLYGAGLARGYLGQADLTAAAFAAADVPGGRLYATGDIGFLRDDGAVVFLGRRDEQIKISGQRLELSEVEAQLNAAPDVARAIATPIIGSEGRTTLGAWVLKAPGKVSIWPSVAEFFVYDDVVYQAMAGDRGRNARYLEGFQRHLPGQTVLEIGPGPYAILSRMAIEAGARHVYAIEINPEIAARARAAVAEAGMQDNITVLTGDATEAVLPEPVDWCISEIVGGIGGSEGAAAILNSVRAKLSSPENMLPRSCVTRIAAVDLPLSHIDPGFSSVAAEYVGRIFEQCGRSFDLRLCLRRFDRDRLVSTSDVFEKLDFTREMALEGGHDIELKVLQDGQMSGFVLWLTMDVGANREINVLGDTSSWLPIYVPLKADGFAVCAGDIIQAKITRKLNAGGRHPDFIIEGTLMRQGREMVPLRISLPHMAPAFGESPLHDHLFDVSGQPLIIEDTFLDQIRGHAAAHLPRYAVPGILREIETLPRTVNGKLARSELPDLIVQGRSVSPVIPIKIPDLAVRISEIFARILGKESVDPTIGFFELGGDSISAVQAVGALTEENIDVTAAEILHHQSAIALSSVARVAHSVSALSQTSPVLLHPVQAWFLSRPTALTCRFNQSVLITLPERVDPANLECALQVLQERHDTLCMTFDLVKGVILPPTKQLARPILSVEDFRTDPSDTVAIRREAVAEQAHSDIDPTAGRLFLARLLRDANQDQLLLVGHHLSVDMLSWRILVGELNMILQDQQIRLPRLRAGYRDICAAMAKEAMSPTTTTERPYWESITDLSETLSIPAPPVGGTAGMLHLRLDIATPELTFEIGKSADTQARLLRAMATAANISFGWSSTLIDLETHGRDLPRQVPDCSGVVGWFTRITPVIVESCGHDNVLTDVPRGGLGFGLLAWQRSDGDNLRQSQAPMALNYLGDLSANPNGLDLQIDWAGLGQGVGANFRTGHGLSVLAHESDTGLFLSLTVDLDLVQPELGEAYGNALRTALQAGSEENLTASLGDIDMGALSDDLGL